MRSRISGHLHPRQVQVALLPQRERARQTAHQLHRLPDPGRRATPGQPQRQPHLVRCPPSDRRDLIGPGGLKRVRWATFRELRQYPRRHRGRPTAPPPPSHRSSRHPREQPGRRPTPPPPPPITPTAPPRHRPPRIRRPRPRPRPGVRDGQIHRHPRPDLHSRRQVRSSAPHASHSRRPVEHAFDSSGSAGVREKGKPSWESAACRSMAVACPTAATAPGPRT